MAFFSNIGRILHKDVPLKYEVDNIFSGMRDTILTVSADQVPSLRNKPVYAVLMEMGRPDAVVTMVTVADGGASIYFSDGGGIIGFGEHENVRKESLEFIACSQQFLPNMSKATSYPLPKPEHTKIFIITPEAVFAATARDRDIKKRSHPLFALWSKGQDVISQMMTEFEKRTPDEVH